MGVWLNKHKGASLLDFNPINGLTQQWSCTYTPSRKGLLNEWQNL